MQFECSGKFSRAGSGAMRCSAAGDGRRTPMKTQSNGRTLPIAHVPYSSPPIRLSIQFIGCCGLFIAFFAGCLRVCFLLRVAYTVGCRKALTIRRPSSLPSDFGVSRVLGKSVFLHVFSDTFSREPTDGATRRSAIEEVRCRPRAFRNFASFVKSPRALVMTEDEDETLPLNCDSNSAA